MWNDNLKIIKFREIVFWAAFISLFVSGMIILLTGKEPKRAQTTGPGEATKIIKQVGSGASKGF